MIDAVVYRAGAVEPSTPDSIEELRDAKAREGTTWVRATGATPEELDRVGRAFDVHPLVIEDVRNNVRPKAEEYPAYTFVLAKEAELARGEQSFDEEISDETVGVVVGDDWVLTLATARVAAVDRVRERVVAGDERLLQRGPDFAAYRVLDVLVDEYFEVLDGIAEQIEAIEEAVVVSTDVSTLEGINEVRRDLLAFRKVAWPMREAVNVLSRGDSAYVQETTEKFYRDVSDHLVQVVDLIETYRDLARGARDIYLSTVSQSTNEVMKTLTIIATIFLPLTFVVGVYGMNHAVIPELAWEGSYFATLAGMTVVAGVMLLYFRERDYL